MSKPYQDILDQNKKEVATWETHEKDCFSKDRNNNLLLKKYEIAEEGFQLIKNLTIENIANLYAELIFSCFEKANIDKEAFIIYLGIDKYQPDDEQYLMFNIPQHVPSNIQIENLYCPKEFWYQDFSSFLSPEIFSLFREKQEFIEKIIEQSAIRGKYEKVFSWNKCNKTFLALKKENQILVTEIENEKED